MSTEEPCFDATAQPEPKHVRDPRSPPSTTTRVALDTVSSNRVLRSTPFG
jgi:hypothetical protein